MPGGMKSTRGQEGSPGPDGQAQQAGHDGCRGDGGWPASVTPLEPSPRARPCARLSSSQEGPLSTAGFILGAGKDKVFGELSRAPEKHRRFLRVSSWLESRVARAPKRRPGPESWRHSWGRVAWRRHSELGGGHSLRAQRSTPQSNPTSEGGTFRDPSLPPVPPTPRQGGGDGLGH